MKKLLILLAFLLGLSGVSLALQDKIAKDKDISRLKRDILQGKVKVGETHLKKICSDYGSAKDIKDEPDKITYDYGDLKIEFKKTKLLNQWEYDSLKKPAYTDDINDLRKDLESKEVYGNNITSEKMIKDYGVPTDVIDSSEDDGITIHYYGDIKLTYQNYIVIKKVTGKNFVGPPTELNSKNVSGLLDSGVLSTKLNESSNADQISAVDGVLRSKADEINTNEVQNGSSSSKANESKSGEVQTPTGTGASSSKTK